MSKYLKQKMKVLRHDFLSRTNFKTYGPIFNVLYMIYKCEIDNLQLIFANVIGSRE